MGLPTLLLIVKETFKSIATKTLMVICTIYFVQTESKTYGFFGLLHPSI